MTAFKGTKKKKEHEKSPEGQAPVPEIEGAQQHAGIPEVEPESVARDVPVETGAAVEGGPAVSSTAGLEDQLLRLKAEYANYKRRTEKEKEDLGVFIKVLILQDILPVLDDFNRFFAHLQQAENGLEKGFVQGVGMIRNNLAKVLEKQGVEPIDSIGVPVDYNLHQAVLTEPVEDKADDHTVRQVLEVGYRLKDRGSVVRHAKVKVGLFGQE